MPKLSSSVPRCRFHKGTGQSVVRLQGRDIYLGKRGSAASKEAYKRFVAEWSEHGGKLVGSPHATTVTEVVIAYAKFATTYYRKDGKPTNEVRMIKSAIKIARQLYGRTPAIKFGPLAPKACRAKMIEQDWSRHHTNKQVGRVKRMFKWATENEMIPGTVCEALRCVAGLKRGRSEAREGRKVTPISDADIIATIEQLPKVVADMVQLQRLTGARPGEICDIRPGDVNRKGDVWEYIPASHKTEHHDRPRVIFIGAKAQRYQTAEAAARCVEHDQQQAQQLPPQSRADYQPLPT
jgi:integrase